MQMLNFLRFGLCIVSFLAVSGCVMNSVPLPPAPLTPEQVQKSVESFEDSRSVQEQVASLALPLLVANAELCEKGTVYGPGFKWITINDLPLESRREVGPALDVGETPSILYVEAGSAAAKTRLRRGDLILAVNGVKIRKDPLQTTGETRRGAVRPYRNYLEELLFRASENADPLRLTLADGELVQYVEFQPQERCEVHVIVTEDSSKVLMSKGEKIYISRGLYDYVGLHRELQALIAHQLAHFILDHGTRSAAGTIAGGIVGGGAALGVIAPLAILGTVLSVLEGELEVGGGEMESLAVVLIASAVTGSRVGSWITTARHKREADYLSAYLLARAGVGPKEAMNVWRRLSKETDLSQKLSASEARLKAIDNVVNEVMAKHNANEPLVPNPKMKVAEARD